MNSINQNQPEDNFKNIEGVEAVKKIKNWPIKPRAFFAAILKQAYHSQPGQWPCKLLMMKGLYGS